MTNNHFNINIIEKEKIMSIDTINTPPAENSLSLIEGEAINELQSPEEQFKNLLIKGDSKERIISLFKQFFGENLVCRAIPSTCFESLPKRLEKADSLYLLGRIGHSVTIDDLEECVAELRSGNHKKLILNGMERNHTTIPYSKLWWAGNARNLSSNEIKILLDLFRNPLKQIEPTYEKELENELRELHLSRPEKLSYSYTTYDYQVQQILKNKSEANTLYFDLAHREPMAKLLAYVNLSAVTKGMIIPCIDEKTNKMVYYELSDHIHKKGMHSYFFTPLNTKENLPAKLIFRGTDDLESIQRDLDPTGIGKTIYDQHALEIITMTQKYLLETKHPKIEVIGHSLGAVDAQRTVLNLLQPSLTHYFEEIALFAFCSPKLDRDTASLMDPYLKDLSGKNVHPKLQFIYANHEKDLITRASDLHLSGSLEHQIPTKCFFVSSDSNFQWVNQHHTLRFFDELGHFDKVDNRTWKFYEFLSKEDLELQILHSTAHIEKLEKQKRELEEQEKYLYRYVLTLKRYFIEVESSKDVEKAIEQAQNRLDKLLMEKKNSENNADAFFLSWNMDHTVNTLLSILSNNHTVQSGLQSYMDYLEKKKS